MIIKRIYAGMIQREINKIEKHEKTPKEQQIGYIGNISYRISDNGYVTNADNILVAIVDPMKNYHELAQIIAHEMIQTRKKNS